jgi:hypothetical protein
MRNKKRGRNRLQERLSAMSEKASRFARADVRRSRLQPVLLRSREPDLATSVGWCCYILYGATP